MADRVESAQAKRDSGASRASNVVRLPQKRPAAAAGPPPGIPAAAPRATSASSAAPVDRDLLDAMEAIGGSAAMIAATLPERHPARVHAARIETLAADLRARAGRARSPTRRFDLLPALEDGLAMARPLVPPTLAIEIARTEDALVAHGAPFDAVRLVVGLLAASRDAALAGGAGTLRIEIDRVVPGRGPAPVAGRVTPGRACAALRVLHASLDPVAPGRGAALVDVARVVRAVGGALRACVSGELTGIEVLWPLAAADAPDLSGLIVLVVGGDGPAIARTADIVETAGAEAYVTLDPEEAMAAFGEDVGEWDCAVVAGDGRAMPAAAIARGLREVAGGLPVIVAGEPAETLADLAVVAGGAACAS